MKIFVKTNDNVYNMELVARYEKVDDNKIKFSLANAKIYIEEYSSENERDDVYNKITNEFTLDLD